METRKQEPVVPKSLQFCTCGNLWQTLSFLSWMCTMLRPCVTASCSGLRKKKKVVTIMHSERRCPSTTRGDRARDESLEEEASSAPKQQHPSAKPPASVDDTVLSAKSACAKKQAKSQIKHAFYPYFCMSKNVFFKRPVHEYPSPKIPVLGAIRQRHFFFFISLSLSPT